MIEHSCPVCTQFSVLDPGPRFEEPQVSDDGMAFRMSQVMWELPMLAHIRAAHPDHPAAAITDEMFIEDTRVRMRAYLRSTMKTITRRRC